MGLRRLLSRILDAAIELTGNKFEHCGISVYGAVERRQVVVDALDAAERSLPGVLALARENRLRVMAAIGRSGFDSGSTAIEFDVQATRDEIFDAFVYGVVLGGMLANPDSVWRLLQPSAFSSDELAPSAVADEYLRIARRRRDSHR